MPHATRAVACPHGCQRNFARTETATERPHCAASSRAAPSRAQTSFKPQHVIYVAVRAPARQLSARTEVPVQPVCVDLPMWLLPTWSPRLCDPPHCSSSWQAEASPLPTASRYEKRFCRALAQPGCRNHGRARTTCATERLWQCPAQHNFRRLPRLTRRSGGDK